eukprot:CAMPEP_0172509514 /NCGR_PEP_ID=MMETSP1066-20121228/220951_1 /TAXON_ID=671091 /ORGANISM="Coscinodiscus wailesii, Strain CCMP2513" /LENGTH=97 /DNA_ID=CAMNT_0013288033 /DNA_START=316 /DNA_END=605 /DNA_ORIENTATION=+
MTWETILSHVPDEVLHAFELICTPPMQLPVLITTSLFFLGVLAAGAELISSAPPHPAASSSNTTTTTGDEKSATTTTSTLANDSPASLEEGQGSGGG